MVRMHFGKHKGQSLDTIPQSYLAWVLKTCHNVDEQLRRSISQELVRRCKPAQAEAERNKACSALMEDPTLDEVDVMTIRTIQVMVEGERTGEFQRGPLLDELWDLIARTHARLRQWEYGPPPRFDLSRLSQRQEN